VPGEPADPEDCLRSRAAAWGDVELPRWRRTDSGRWFCLTWSWIRLASTRTAAIWPPGSGCGGARCRCSGSPHLPVRLPVPAGNAEQSSCCPARLDGPAE